MSPVHGTPLIATLGCPNSSPFDLQILAYLTLGDNKAFHVQRNDRMPGKPHGDLRAGWVPIGVGPEW